MFPEVDQMLHVQCVYKKPASVNNSKIWHKKIVLPHPIYDPNNTTICLIMPDFDRSKEAWFDPDVDKQARMWEEKLGEEFGLNKSLVQKILTHRQLGREYHTYLEKRQLASAYDIFLVDASIGPRVWYECGKEFHKAKKMPLCVDTNKRNLIEQIKKSFSTISFPLSAHRVRTSLKIGNLSESSEDLCDNIEEAAARLAEYCPGGLPNIRSINLQVVSGGPTIPIYADTGSVNAVRMPKMVSKKERYKLNEFTDELSTLPEGLKVTVRPDGRTSVIDEQTGKKIYYPTVHDEWEEKDDLKPKIDPLKLQLERTKKRRLKEKKAKRVAKRLRLAKETGEGAEKVGNVVKTMKKIMETRPEKKEKKSGKENKKKGVLKKD
ncbi:unnamed protein product [Anisakis simplex]|uniref:Uncharacterized protein n=1 Tax=Anisakis simplex TaxID=6269 RepID=A0A3P6R0S4_ANISI|nr:unnamed protein product [Anisakis simplex]